MTSDLSSGNDATICPKHLWVLNALSDDEERAEVGSLPQGLKFHLSRCDSCRALADRLQEVSGMLDELAGLEPSDELCRGAEAQVLDTLTDGARLTGRARIPEEPIRGLGTATRISRWALPRYAAAAVILAAAGLFTVARLGGPGEQVADAPPVERVPTPVDREPSPVVALNEDAGPVTEKPAVGEGVETAAQEAAPASDDLADITPAPIRHRFERATCRHYSHIDAAMCENPKCIPRTTILPDPRQRTLGLSSQGFDK